MLFSSSAVRIAENAAVASRGYDPAGSVIAVRSNAWSLASHSSRGRRASHNRSRPAMAVPPNVSQLQRDLRSGGDSTQHVLGEMAGHDQQKALLNTRPRWHLAVGQPLGVAKDVNASLGQAVQPVSAHRRFQQSVLFDPAISGEWVPLHS
jgi:hypothetical protein